MFTTKDETHQPKSISLGPAVSFVLYPCACVFSKLADLEREARAMGADVPPPPNAAMLAKLMDGGRGGGLDGAGGRGFGR